MSKNKFIAKTEKIEDEIVVEQPKYEKPKQLVLLKNAVIRQQADHNSLPVSDIGTYKLGKIVKGTNVAGSDNWLEVLFGDKVFYVHTSYSYEV